MSNPLQTQYSLRIEPEQKEGYSNQSPFHQEASTRVPKSNATTSSPFKLSLGTQNADSNQSSHAEHSPVSLLYSARANRFAGTLTSSRIATPTASLPTINNDTNPKSGLYFLQEKATFHALARTLHKHYNAPYNLVVAIIEVWIHKSYDVKTELHNHLLRSPQNPPRSHGLQTSTTTDMGPRYTIACYR